jgi:hypothetical protein
MPLVIKISWLFALLLLPGYCATAQNAPPDLRGYLDVAALPGRKFVVESEGTRRGQRRHTVLVNVSMSLAEVRARYGLVSQLPVRYDRDSLLLVFAAVEDDVSRELWQPYQEQPPVFLAPEAFLADCLSRLDRYKRQGPGAYNDVTRYVFLKPVLTMQGVKKTFTGIVLTEAFLVMPIPGLLFGQADNVTINVLAPVVSEGQLEQSVRAYRRYFNTSAESFTDMLPSKVLLEQKTKGLYYFWTCPPGLMDAPNFIHGAEDFVYRPGVGILTGTYSSFTGFDGRDFKVTRLTRLK